MATNDILANALSLMLNNELTGKQECLIKPVSKVIKNVINIMKKNGYISDFSEVKDGRGNYLKLKLSGTINKCGVIKPRFNVKIKNIEKFEKIYLPAKDMGILMLSTPFGITTHYEAKKKNTGGRLLAYCY